MPAEEIKAGHEYRLYYKDTTWKAFYTAQDIQVNDSPEMHEARLRGDTVIRSIPGQIEGEITFDCLYLEGALDVDFLITNELARTAIEVAWTFDNIATAATVYRRDWFNIKIQKSAPIAGTPALSVTLTPALQFTSNAQVVRSTETVAGP